MPELPEVETIRRGVERLVVGRVVVNVDVLVPKILKPPVADPEEFAGKLIGGRFVNAVRRGKHLIFGLDNGYALYAHLNMRGQFVLVADSSVPQAKYLCIVISLDTGSELRYHDIWTWGELRVLKDTCEELVKYVPALADMGPEPLSSELDGEVLKKRASSRSKSPIKVVLLDQAVVAGVGNIYADESLFRAGVNPLRKTGTLIDSEWAALAESIKGVLTEAVASGGTLSDNYVDIEGSAGRYKPDVYGRAKLPCVQCAEPLFTARTGGRSTVYCAICQK